MGVHLYSVNVEFPAAIWSVVVWLSDPPKVGDPIDVKGIACVVRAIKPRSENDSDTGSVVANVYANPAAGPQRELSSENG